MPPKKAKPSGLASISDDVIAIDSNSPSSSGSSKSKSIPFVPKNISNSSGHPKASSSGVVTNGHGKSGAPGNGSKKSKSSHLAPPVPVPHFGGAGSAAAHYAAVMDPFMGGAFMAPAPQMPHMVPYGAVGAGPAAFQQTASFVSAAASYYHSPGTSVQVHHVAPGAHVHVHHKIGWDPDHQRDWDTSTPSSLCLKRMQNDLQSVLKDEEEMNLYVLPNETDITKFFALIVGPQDTPYEGGFFLFTCRVGPTYPLIPPKVKNLTTHGGRLRFGPNIYADGKICLSILGTWEGPSWTAVMNIRTMLTSIQSLMSVDAMRNEPGFERHKAGSKECINYDRCVRHEVLKYAVIECLETAMKREQTLWPEKFRLAMFSYFVKNCDKLVSSVDKEMSTHGNPIQCTFGQNLSKTYDWKDIRAKLLSLKKLVGDLLNTMKPIEIS